MNTLELMDASVSSFSKTDRQIYESIRKFPEEFATRSITEVSDNTRVTKPALTRFAKKLGFSGFAELQYQLTQDLKEMRENPIGESTSEKYASLLIQTDKSVDKEAIRRLIRKMKSSRRNFRLLFAFCIRMYVDRRGHNLQRHGVHKNYHAF